MITLHGIEFDGCEIRFTRKVTLDEFEEAMRTIATILRFGPWWVGEIINTCLDRWGDIGWNAADCEHLTERQINLYSKACKAIPPENRRLELSFTHHEQVMKRVALLHQAEILETAVTDGMTTAELRKYVPDFVRNKRRKSCS